MLNLQKVFEDKEMLQRIVIRQYGNYPIKDRLTLDRYNIALCHTRGCGFSSMVENIIKITHKDTDIDFEIFIGDTMDIIASFDTWHLDPIDNQRASVEDLNQYWEDNEK